MRFEGAEIIKSIISVTWYSPCNVCHWKGAVCKQCCTTDYTLNSDLHKKSWTLKLTATVPCKTPTNKRISELPVTTVAVKPPVIVFLLCFSLWMVSQQYALRIFSLQGITVVPKATDLGGYNQVNLVKLKRIWNGISENHVSLRCLVARPLLRESVVGGVSWELNNK